MRTLYASVDLTTNEPFQFEADSNALAKDHLAHHARATGHRMARMWYVRRLRADESWTPTPTR